MRFISLSTVLAAATLGGVTTVQGVAHLSQSSFSSQLSPENHYGSPVPPWESGAKPGWYYGTQPSLLGSLESEITYLADSLVCLILDLIPGCLHCPPTPPKPHKSKTSSAPASTSTCVVPPPPPPSNWTQTMFNFTCATQGNDFQTFGLVDTIEDCMTMCLNVQGCTFINTYHDNNGKDGSPLLTCSLFSLCHTQADADNCGGQSQPDGSVDFITNSDGFCLTGEGGVLPSGFTPSVATPSCTPVPSSSSSIYYATPTPTPTYY